RSAAVSYYGEMHDVAVADDAILSGFDVVLFASGEDASERFVPALLAANRIVIDNSSTFRLRDGVPLVVPEINASSIRAMDRLFPVANCTAIVLCMALAPIARIAGLRSVIVSTYQAASGAGRAGLDELFAGERAAVHGDPDPTPVIFAAPLAHNVLPQIGSFGSDGWTGEESKVRDETRAILNLPELDLIATCVRVPVRTAHSESLVIVTERPTTSHALAAALQASPGIVFHQNGIVTPRDVEGTDEVHVARLRSLDAAGTRFALWAVGDQLRKGAATNAVQILELILSRGGSQG
ncbi:MAG: aspartate-semialdehyde dehydrogenase, partial [Vulcanimicrobiaceae bacterium]